MKKISPEMDRVVADIYGLADLKPGWNSYDAPAINPKSMAHARRIARTLCSGLARVSVAPLPSGNVGLVWRIEDGSDFTLEVEPDAVQGGMDWL